MAVVEQLTMQELPHVHFVGIGGAGMGAIASIMLDRGYFVSGSDVAIHEHTKKLEAKGATVYLGHDSEHIVGADYVVYSTAVSLDNVELCAAREQKIPILHRSEMLARLMEEGRGIAVAGAHGKTTTTSMIAFILMEADLDPTFLIGGILSNLNTSARAGTGDFIVAEADESDGSFLNYRPAISVVTNIEADHLEHYGGRVENLQEAYRKFAHLVQPGGLLVVCADDKGVREVLSDCPVRMKTYSIEGRPADLQAVDMQFSDAGSSSKIVLHGETLGILQLSVSGGHNVADALAALLVTMEVGVPFLVATAALLKFHGALRRLQVLYDDGRVRIIDDYAHHPTEIRKMIHTVKASGKRVLAAFQPQRYTRTYYLFDQFTEAFDEADDVMITDIYSPAGEQPIAGVSAEHLVEKIQQRGHLATRHCASKEDLLSYLKSVISPGDVVLTMGAGDIWKVARELAGWMKEQQPSENYAFIQAQSMTDH